MAKKQIEETSESNEKIPKRRRVKKTTFAEAQKVFLKLKEEKEEERKKAREDREKRNKAIEQDNKNRKKMNQALKKKNKKGQPNLNAQVEVLLERIQKRVAKDK